MNLAKVFFQQKKITLGDQPQHRAEPEVKLNLVKLTALNSQQILVKHGKDCMVKSPSKSMMVKSPSKSMELV